MWRSYRFLDTASVVILAMIALSFPVTLWASPQPGQFVLGPLDNALCPDNRGIFVPRNKVDEAAFLGDCVLAFGGPDEGGGEGKEAVMRLNGADVQLRVTRRVVSLSKAHYEFTNRSLALKVVVDVKEECPKNFEGCNYSGSLAMVSPSGSSRVHIVYYRGG